MSAVLQPLTLERLAESDIDDVYALERQSYAAPWSRDSFRAELTNHMARYLVLRRKGKLIGYGGEWLVIDEAHITTIAVHLDERRKGYGELLLVELLETAASEDMVRATLEVRENNGPAIQLYEKFGFRSVAVRKNYYPDKENALVMWLNELAQPEYRARLAESRKESWRRARSGD
jgi:ribosomal-protein-alanine N-acetyltransferase